VSNPCPSEATLLAFADDDLPPEKLLRLERHLETCGVCAKQVMALSELIEDVAAPVASPPFDAAEHAAAVMKRLDAPLGHARRVPHAVWGGLFAVVAAAAALVLLLGRGPSAAEGNDGARGHFSARGGRVESALGRDVGVQVYAVGSTLRPLASGGSISPGTALAVGVRNLGQGPAYALLFAIDSQQVVHWIAPEFNEPGADPEALHIGPLRDERLLSTQVVFDDLAPGALRVVTLVSSEPSHVSQVEALSPGELGSAALSQRFPRAEVREITLMVTR
jgi:hypothetical protein